MKLLLAIVCIAAGVSAVKAQAANVETFRFKEDLAFTTGYSSHTVRLTVRTAQFDPTKRKVTRFKTASRGEGEMPMIKIDGRAPLGTSGDLPATEIRSMSVMFDGVEIIVPRRYFADFYNPNFNSDRAGTKLSDDGTSLLVFMSGGTKDNSYNVIWVLRKNGEHVKFFNNCGDCEFKDFLKFLQRK